MERQRVRGTLGYVRLASHRGVYTRKAESPGVQLPCQTCMFRLGPYSCVRGFVGEADPEGDGEAEGALCRCLVVGASGGVG